MIGKEVRRDKATSDFDRLGRYILEARDEEAQILWTRTAEYILDAKGEGEKVAWSRITNCESDIPGIAIAEILTTQSENKRAKGDKTYHLVISFPEGEHPTREQLEDIEDVICTGLGFEGHQRLSAVHINTENTHIHIAINKIHPQTLRYIDPYRDHYRLDELCEGLEIKHGLIQDNRVGSQHRHSKARDGEAHSGEESLLTWITENAGDVLTKAQEEGQDWQDLHGALARFGLEIRPRGAGLVISLKDRTLAVKASSVNRTLSMKSLTDRWGEYQPSTEKIKVIQPEQQYEKGPRHRHSHTGSLYAEYQQLRETSSQVRQEMLSKLRQEHEQYGSDLKRYYAERRTAVQIDTTLSPWKKRQAYKALSKERQDDFIKRRQLEKAQRQSLLESNPFPTWQTFLQKEAEKGNTDALLVLRGRQQRQRRMAADILTAESAEEARHIVLAHLHPQARKNGNMIYRIQDGGLLTDEGTQVIVEQITTGAVFLALSLADERFKGKALIVSGTDDFKQQVLELSIKEGFNITFSDSDMEQERQRMLNGGEQQAESPQTKQKANPNEPKNDRGYQGR